MSDRFIYFILTVTQSATLAVCVFRATTKKAVNFFEEKSAPRRKSWLRLCPSALSFCAPNVKSWLLTLGDLA